MESANSGARTQSVAGFAAPTMVPTAVPQAPPPITATRSLIAQEPTTACRAPRRDPYTVPVSRATVAPTEHAGPALDPPLGPAAVLIPVKAFGQAKRRLGSALSDTDRIHLVRAMA